MKKSLSILLIVALVMSSMLMASATKDTIPTKITKDDAVSSVIKALKNGWNYSLNPKANQASTQVNESPYKFLNNFYNVEWNFEENDQKVFIRAKVDGVTGFVTNLLYKKSAKTYEDKQDPLLAISDEDAKKMAQEFVNKVFADKKKDLELVSSKAELSGNDINFEYIFIRKHNGAYVNNNYIAVTVSNNDKKVIGYSSNWYENVKFADKKGLVNKFQANKTIQDLLNLELSFYPIIKLNDYTTKTNLPVYRPSTYYANALDAKTGELIDFPEWKVVAPLEFNDITDAKKTEIFNQNIELKQNTEPISKEAATEVVNKYIVDIYGEGYTITSLTLEDNSSDSFANVKYKWQATFENEKSTGKLNFNALTERLILTSLKQNKDNTSTETDSTLSVKEAYDKAIALIQKYYPDKINEVTTKMNLKSSNNYQFIFTRKVNDVLYYYNGIAIEFDKYTQKPKYIDMTWDINPPESSDKLIDKSTALKKFFENYQPELYYVLHNTAPKDEDPSYEMRLIYSLPQSHYNKYFIDANNGQMISSNLVKIDSNESHDFINTKYVTKYNAVKALLDLTKYLDISYSKITDIELKFTDISKNNSHYDVIKSACLLGIIDNTETAFNESSYISREDFAIMMIKLLGHQEVAELRNVYKLSFIDSSKIAKNKYGYVALGVGFNLLQAENNKIRPQDNLNELDLLVAYQNLIRLLDTGR